MREVNESLKDTKEMLLEIEKRKPWLRHGQNFGKMIMLVIIWKIDSVPNRIVYLHGYISTQCTENTNWLLHASYEKTQEDKYKLEKKMFTFQWEYGWHISNSRCGSNLNYLIPYALHIEKEVQTKKEGGPQGKYKFYGTSRSRCKNPKGITVRHSIKNLERFKAVLHSSSQLYKR